MMTKRKKYFDDLASLVEGEVREAGVGLVVRKPFPDLTNDNCSPAPDNRDRAIERCDAFDYSEMPPDKRRALMDSRNRIAGSLKRTIISVGRDLLEAKVLIREHCRRGSWTIWLQTAIGVSESTARNWMAAAEWVAESPIVGEMNPGAIYRGATAPSEVQAEVVRVLKNGGNVTADDITLMKAQNKNGSVPARMSDDRSSTSTVNPSDQNDDDGEQSRAVLVRCAAAVELVARLREAFDDQAILDLIGVWRKASAEAVIDVLTNGSS